MKELSLNILDIVENSVKAKAALTEILLNETDAKLKITVKDNGCGMSEEVLASVENPFYTTRTTRKVGLGIPLFKEAAEQTGGTFSVFSVSEAENKEKHGTVITAEFNKNHIDYTPLGDIVSTLVTLIQGHPDTDFLFVHSINGETVSLDTRQLRKVTEDIPLNSFEIINWINGYLKESYLEIKTKIQ